MGSTNSNKGCGCWGCIYSLIFAAAVIAVLINAGFNKLKGNYFSDPTNVYAQPVESAELVAEIHGTCSLIGSPKEERGGWTLADFEGFSGWVKTSAINHFGFGQLGDKTNPCIWVANNLDIVRTGSSEGVQACSKEFRVKFGDVVYPYASKGPERYYYNDSDEPFSVTAGSRASQNLVESRENFEAYSISDSFVAKECSFYYLNLEDGSSRRAGVLPVGTPIKLGRPNFEFPGKNSNLGVLLGEYTDKSIKPCVIEITETNLSTTKPGTLPTPVQWDK